MNMSAAHKYIRAQRDLSSPASTLPACHCLYCGILTGHGSGNPTVCGTCTWSADKDERREVEAGVSGGRPWRRPLSFWVGFFGWKAMPDDEAAAAQDKWDAEQERIKQFNAEHAGQRNLP